MGGDSTRERSDSIRDADLEAAYRAALYVVELPSGRVVLRIGERAAGLPGPFAIVTAWNPGLERPPREVNEARNRALLAEVERRGLVWATAEGRSPDGSHREPSLAVFVDSLEDGLALARKFGQAAICWFDGEKLELVWC
ncbi:DUF3293 domain-containing protein [Tepidiforma sp.]|uniref:DUF3293 domain-containing protein n=1 Tax=Tepidiforma sp. TaxID=2682230 RepID=UPI002ADD5EB2|nr:DUF3293 domain-containing protein [Tepidiforma sp.]